MRIATIAILVLLTFTGYAQKRQKINELVVKDTLIFQGGNPATNKVAVSMDGNGNFKWVYFTDFQDSINQGVYDTILASYGLFDSIRINGLVTDSSAHVLGANDSGVVVKCVALCNDLRWTTVDGTQTVLRDSTDFVGIGTSAPTAKLHVEGDVFIKDDSISNFITSILLSGDSLYRNASGEYNYGLAIKGVDVANPHIKGYSGVTFNGDIEELQSEIVIIDTTDADGLEDFVRVTKDRVEIFTNNGINSAQIIIDPNNVEIFSPLTYQDGTQANGYVLTSDALGNATWQDPDSLNCETGWESITDNTNTWTIAAGDTQTILIERDITVNPQLPCGIDSLYNSLDSTIIGLDGDAYTISLDWTTTQNTNNATEFKWWINIGGAVGIIYPTTYEQNKGLGVDKQYNKTTTVYTLDTWEANGGKIQFTTDQSITISNVRVNIFRIHKAR